MTQNDLLYKSSFLLVALTISVAALVFDMLDGRNRKKRSKRIFTLLLLDLIFSAACSVLISIAMYVCQGYPEARSFYDLCQLLYFASHSLLAPLFYIYILEGCGVFFKQKRLLHALLMIPCIVSEILVLSNPITAFVYRTDANFVFTRGLGEYFIYLSAAFYFVMGGFVLFYYWNRLAVNKRWALIYCYVMAIIGVLIQLFNRNLRVELVFESLALMAALLHLENEDDKLDALTGFYNRSALRQDILNMQRVDRPFYVICIHIANSDVAARVTGTTGRDAVVRMVGEYLGHIFDRNRIYRAAPSCFIMLVTELDEDKVKDMIDKVVSRFDMPWKYYDKTVTELKLTETILWTPVKDDFGTAEDVFLLVDTDVSTLDSRRVYSVDELSFIKKNVEIETALRRSMTEHNYEILYQPVYNFNTNSMHAINAYLCINDPVLGRVMPYEYDAIARNTGIKETLDDRLIDEVFVFLSSGIPIGMGLKTIDIDISAMKFIQTGFIDNIRNAVERYSIDPSKVCFEIKDIGLIQEAERFKAGMTEIKDMGFRIDLDRYGSENVETDLYTSFDYELISIDLMITKDFDDNSLSYKLLKQSIEMIQELKKDVLIKNVNSFEQFSMIGQMSIDFVQGDYYSEAVTQNEIIAILKATESARKEEQKALAQSEAKSSFLANMSHEIRTPINAILGMNEMIIRESSEEPILQYAYDIERACTSLLSIINDVLDFSKIEAGSVEIIDAEYELSSLIHDVTNMIRVKTDEKGLELHIEVDEGLPDRLYGDEARLRQILINLMNNAVKYTNEGSITLRIKGYRTMEAFRLGCDIIDTGIGIKEEDRDKLFDKFTRLDMEKNRTVEGSGLGLAITYNLLVMMHGNISVDSEYGKGSTFSIVVPQKVVDSKPIGNLENRYKDISDSHQKYKKSFTAESAKILVVDDTPINLTVIKGLLKQTKVSIDTATGGAEALEKIENTTYDLILLDYRMPEIDGSEVLVRMKASKTHVNQKTPIVVLTANAMSGAREKFMSEGFDDYLSKPVSGEKLEATIVKYLPKDKLILSDSEDKESR